MLNSFQPNQSPDYSDNYVPEPWWGNDGENEHPLYSVCVNLNPGKAQSPLQTRKNPGVIGIKDYTDLFAVLHETNRWHNDKRALPIRKALMGMPDIPSRAIDNHLSIELIPWHTEHADSKHGYWVYISQPAVVKAVFDHTFCFASTESGRVIGPLKDTVLLRFSGEVALRLFSLFKKEGFLLDYEVYSLKVSNPNVHAWVFTSSTFAGKYFISIWRSRGYGLNNFPREKDMKQVISSFSLLKSCLAVSKALNGEFELIKNIC